MKNPRLSPHGADTKVYTESAPAVRGLVVGSKFLCVTMHRPLFNISRILFLELYHNNNANTIFRQLTEVT